MAHDNQSGARRVKNQLRVRSARTVSHGLKAALVSNTSTNEIPTEQAGDAFRDLLEFAMRNQNADGLADPPTVDLTFNIANENETPYTLRLGHDAGALKLSLTGRGFVRVPVSRAFTADFRQGHAVVIQPGESYSIPVKSLQCGFRNEIDRRQPDPDYAAKMNSRTIAEHFAEYDENLQSRKCFLPSFPKLARSQIGGNLNSFSR